MRLSGKNVIRKVAAESPFRRGVYAATKQIPRGRVATYKDIARAIGKPWAMRAVGNALNKNPYKSVPCHRVIHSDGSIGGYAGGTSLKIKILNREGVSTIGGKVDLEAYGVKIKSLS